MRQSTSKLRSLPLLRPAPRRHRFPTALAAQASPPHLPLPSRAHRHTRCTSPSAHTYRPARRGGSRGRWSSGALGWARRREASQRWAAGRAPEARSGDCGLVEGEWCSELVRGLEPIAHTSNRLLFYVQRLFGKRQTLSKRADSAIKSTLHQVHPVGALSRPAGAPEARLC